MKNIYIPYLGNAWLNPDSLVAVGYYEDLEAAKKELMKSLKNDKAEDINFDEERLSGTWDDDKYGSNGAFFIKTCEINKNIYM